MSIGILQNESYFFDFLDIFNHINSELQIETDEAFPFVQEFCPEISNQNVQTDQMDQILQSDQEFQTPPDQMRNSKKGTKSNSLCDIDPTFFFFPNPEQKKNLISVFPLPAQSLVAVQPPRTFSRQDLQNQKDQKEIQNAFLKIVSEQENPENKMLIKFEKQSFTQPTEKTINCDFHILNTEHNPELTTVLEQKKVFSVLEKIAPAQEKGLPLLEKITSAQEKGLPVLEENAVKQEKTPLDQEKRTFLLPNETLESIKQMDDFSFEQKQTEKEERHLDIQEDLILDEKNIHQGISHFESQDSPHVNPLADKQDLVHRTHHKILDMADKLQASRGGTAKVQIEDGDLGKIDLQIKMNGSQSISVQISTNNTELRKSLEDKVQSLKEDLVQHKIHLEGVKISTLEIDSTLKSQNQQQSQSQSNFQSSSYSQSQQNGQDFKNSSYPWNSDFSRHSHGEKSRDMQKNSISNIQRSANGSIKVLA